MPPDGEDGTCDDKCAGSVRGFAARVHGRLNGLSPVLLLLYFANAFALTLPMQANTGWLTNLVRMPLSDLSNYYALIFLPNSLKPLYAVAIDHIPMPRVGTVPRRVFIILTGAGSAACYVLKAHTVRSVPAAFAVGFAHVVCDSCSELVLSACLIDAAHRGMRNAGALQAAVTAARYLGSLAASLLTLHLYRCNGFATTTAQEHGPGNVLMWTAVCPLSTVILAFFLPSDRPAPPAATPADPSPAAGTAGEGGRERRDEEGEEEGEEKAPGRMVPQTRRLAVGACAAAFAVQTAVVWISIQHFVQPSRSLSGKWVWWLVLALLCASGAGISAAVLWATEGPRALLRRSARYVPPALFIFAASAVPSAAVQLAAFQYDLFFYGRIPPVATQYDGEWAFMKDPALFRECWSPYVSIIGYAARLAAAAAYGFLFNAWDVRWVLVGTTVVSAAAGLLQLPIVSLTSTRERVTALGGSWPQFAYHATAAAVCGFFGQLAFIPRQVVATESSPARGRVLAYACFLAFLDAGDSASQWIAAPIVDALGIRCQPHGACSFAPGLRRLLWLNAGLSIGVLALLPLLRRAGGVPRGADDRSRSDIAGLGEGSASPLLCSASTGDGARRGSDADDCR